MAGERRLSAGTDVDVGVEAGDVDVVVVLFVPDFVGGEKTVAKETVANVIFQKY